MVAPRYKNNGRNEPESTVLQVRTHNSNVRKKQTMPGVSWVCVAVTFWAMSASVFIELLHIFGQLACNRTACREKLSGSWEQHSAKGWHKQQHRPLPHMGLQQSTKHHIPTIVDYTASICIISNIMHNHTDQTKGHNVHTNTFIESKLRRNLLPTLLVTHIPYLGSWFKSRTAFPKADFVS